MSFRFTGNGLTGKEAKLQRMLEILPGLTSWTIIIGMVILAYVHPLYAAIIIIAFYLYWLLRLLYMTLFLIFSYVRLSAEKNTNWMERVASLNDIDKYLEEIKARKGGSFKEKLSRISLQKDIERLKSTNVKLPKPDDVYHLVLIPVAKEPREIFEPGIKGLTKSTFPTKRMVVVLALEERAPHEIKKDAKALKDLYGNTFFDFLIIEHPDGVIGEAKAKGANTTYAAKEAAKYFREKNIPFDNIVSSCFDSDTVVSADYFASLTYYFITCPDRERASFQPVPVYNNNIWEAPGITRVLEVGSSFFQLIESTNPTTLVTFSSHSMSFKALVEVDYWPVDMISDDSAIFWKAFLHYDGKYQVVPMYTTLSMDAVTADSAWQTVINVYKQRRRWAWGVENLPIVVRGFLKNRAISFFKKLKYIYKLFEGHISWTTWGFLLTVIGWLPALFAGKDYSHSVFYYSAPRITGTIFNLASFSLITSIILSLCLLPKSKGKHSIIKRIGFAFQWLLVPFTIVFLTSVPALDAQTRMMLGRYMTFWVTDKGRKKT